MTIYFKQARRRRKRREVARESMVVVMTDRIDLDALQELKDHMAMQEAGYIPWVVMPTSSGVSSERHSMGLMFKYAGEGEEP